MPRKSRKPDFRRVLVERLDPDQSIRDLIDSRLARYAGRRPGNDAGSAPSQKDTP